MKINKQFIYFSIAVIAVLGALYYFLVYKKSSETTESAMNDTTTAPNWQTVDNQLYDSFRNDAEYKKLNLDSWFPNEVKRTYNDPEGVDRGDMSGFKINGVMTKSGAWIATWNATIGSTGATTWPLEPTKQAISTAYYNKIRQNWKSFYATYK